MKLKHLFFGIIYFISSSAIGQVSYSDFKNSYTPHNKPGISETNEGVKAGNGMGSKELAGYLEEYINQNNKDVFNAIITSIKRNHAGATIDNMLPARSIQGLNWLKDEWVYEVLYYTSEKTYTTIAPYLTAMKNYKGDPKGDTYIEVKKWNPLYAGAGAEFAYGGFRGINKWVEAYNTSGPKAVPGSTSTVAVTTPMPKMHWQKGFGLFTGLKINSTRVLEIYFSHRAASTGAILDNGTYERNIKYAANYLNIGLLNKTNSSGKINTYSGIALVTTFGGMKAQLNQNGTKGEWEKIANSSVFNIGVNFNYMLQVPLSNKIPLMLTGRSFFQLNFLPNDFNPLNDRIPNIFTDEEKKKLKSGVSSIGIQVGLAYSFRKKKEKLIIKEMPIVYDETVNTIFDELNPIIAPDGKTLYFSRNNDPRNKFGTDDSQDIWMADVSNGVETAKAVHLTSPFNKSRYNFMAGITPDENTILISGAFSNGVSEGRGYSLMHRTKTGWSEPEKMNIEGFQDLCKGNYAGAMLSNDGKHLVQYFSEVKENETYDLYVSHLKDDGSWTRPSKLGNINTSKNEMSPFLASDGITMYFSSNRPGGLGNNDIYMTKRLDDTWKKWSEPVNMGSEVNTDAWDAYYCLDAQGEYAYKVSNVPGKVSDIVRIKLKKDVRPEPVVLVKGRVLNAKTKEPLEASVTYSALSNNGQSGVARTNPSTGEYKIVLPYGSEYSFLGEADKFVSVSNNLNITQVGEYKVIESDIYLFPLEVGSTVRLNNIFFETGKSTLDDKSQNELMRLVNLLKDNPEMEIEVSGHTDNVGSADLNKKLSFDRATAVVAYLQSKGIATSRLKAVGYGMTKPVATNDNDEGKALNRRVEFTITKR